MSTERHTSTKNFQDNIINIYRTSRDLGIKCFIFIEFLVTLPPLSFNDDVSRFTYQSTISSLKISNEKGTLILMKEKIRGLDLPVSSRSCAPIMEF